MDGIGLAAEQHPVLGRQRRQLDVVPKAHHAHRSDVRHGVDVERPRERRYVGGKKPDAVEARREREHPRERVPASGRLEPVNVAAGGGDSDRAARVGAQSKIADAPAATATAEPPLEPPAVLKRSRGANIAPKCGL